MPCVRSRELRSRDALCANRPQRGGSRKGTLAKKEHKQLGGQIAHAEKAADGGATIRTAANKIAQSIEGSIIFTGPLLCSASRSCHMPRDIQRFIGFPPPPMLPPTKKQHILLDSRRGRNIGAQTEASPALSSALEGLQSRSVTAAWP